MVAFGAPAGKVRSKAKTYKEFIKRGTRTAQITVTISNEGLFLVPTPVPQGSI